MPAIIKIKESKSKRTKCSCCQEIIPTCQQFSQVGRDKYCHSGDCHTKYLPMNHPDAIPEHANEPDLEGDAERQREAYAAYDNKENFWRDKDAGLV